MTVLLVALTACKKEESYERFEGNYDVKSSGNINYFIDDTTFTNEPGSVVIKKGDESDEIFMYVETDFVTSIAPLGVYATATLDGNEYDMEGRNLSINIDLGGQVLSLAFNVDATGVLSDDGKTLTSEVVFSGGITGTLTSVGTKK